MFKLSLCPKDNKFMIVYSFAQNTLFRLKTKRFCK